MDGEAVRPGSVKELILDGYLSIERAIELKNKLIHALSKTDHLAIKLEKVVEVDLACLQLFCSAHRTALKLNKQLTVNSEDSKLFQQMVRDSGYFRRNGCFSDPYSACLWCGGEE
ncbi:MAG: STAS domain-containing protein [Proteobacteria bacterium]|nr:STAS domain-containing protein [Pseudomonadota bacterium]